MRYKDEDLVLRITDYITNCTLEEGRQPTVREIGSRFGVSKSTAQNYVTLIRKKKLCQRLEKYNGEFEQVARLENKISCGSPCFEEQNIMEYFRLPTAVFGKGQKYILTATGDSMIGEGITEGDTLVVRKQVTAEDGDIVVALLNGENTLKRLRHHEDGTPFLHPENPEHKDIEIGPWDTFYIQGVLTHIIKEVKEAEQ
ncbi:MAG: repressor LexA [Oscillospiraceae bacterium]|nr:repressor LexA [Oscillospiraceae bacterium]